MRIRGLARRSALVIAVAGAGVAMLSAEADQGLPRLPAETEQAWTELVARVERQWDVHASDPIPIPPRDAVSVEPGSWDTARGGRQAALPHALAHHWRGRVLIRGISLDALLERLRTDRPGENQEDVLSSSILAHSPSSMTVHLRVRRSKVLTAVFDTEHDVTTTRVDERRAMTRSVATSIVEVERPGSANERLRAADDNRGLLWRWHAYWRYDERVDGVLAECESLTLSRRVPAILRLVVNPLVESVARESMVRTLTALRDRYSR